MSRLRLCLLVLLPCIYLAACSPGHLGQNEIAFVRDGHLWTIDPGGANAFEVVSDTSPVIGYGWSPDHQIFVFRELDSHYASSAAGKHLQTNALTGLPGDLPASLNTISIDGGMPIPIIDSSSGMQVSNAWWNTGGNRLLYREEPAQQQSLLPLTASWYVSQNDQPNGVARKTLPTTYSIPSFNSDSALAIGNTDQGVFTTSLAGADFHFLAQGALPGHPLPASLERILWQPDHQQPMLLYAVIATTTPQQPASGTVTPAVQLVLRGRSASLSSIATCYCTQFAWSPDGNSILYSAGAAYSIYNINKHTSLSYSAEAGGVPYWSPDSRSLLLDGLHSLSLINIAGHSQQTLLSDNSKDNTRADIPDANALVQPLSNSLWAADSRHFLILTRGRWFWHGQRLSQDDGIYIVALNNQEEVNGAPSLVITGHESQPGWSYEDPNTSFLFP